jgi:hypothetical protein
MSVPITSRPLSAAMRSAICTDSRETTHAYVMMAGGSVMCPPATSLVLRVKSSLTSKSRRVGICRNPTGMCCSFSRMLKAIQTFFISFSTDFSQRSSPFSLSRERASAMVLGTLIPNFTFLRTKRALTAKMMLSRFFRV